MARKIKLMADYRCYPLWWEDTDKVGNIEPKTLSLKEETITRLEKEIEPEYEVSYFSERLNQHFTYLSQIEARLRVASIPN
ncbi:MAG: hypothetical protein DSM107014_01870 [Gomphosphaeria aponina SAG 52.96 = DSM 107014]|uniref:Uncharacterized protein n=1 Tax=Gomphosphaeria aponina SAG 52.96 = DSM 107014 TaxID=1521640 RepID=A0A941JL26_9CHRO|nr:hypothetical protein [Gomphosphaeria aponina SAG 52.96 = DSM 107014]